MRSRSSLRALWRGSAVLAIAAMLMVAATPVAVAMVDQYGAGAFSAPYAPYTAGPVVAETPARPYAPYTAPYETGPVIHESELQSARPYAPYTAGPVVTETRPYAPYEAGPVIHESDLQ